MTPALSSWRSRRLLELVVERDGRVCGRCSRPIPPGLPGTHPLGLTLGHVVPRSLGGPDTLANTRPEHRGCNLAAGNRPSSPIALLASPSATAIE